MIHLLEASKPPEGADVMVVASGAAAAAGAGVIGTAATTAGTGGVGEGREPRASKPDSKRSFCTGAEARAGARGARAGAAVGARVGDIRPEGCNRQETLRKKDACGTVSYHNHPNSMTNTLNMITDATDGI